MLHGRIFLACRGTRSPSPPRTEPLACPHSAADSSHDPRRRQCWPCTISEVTGRRPSLVHATGFHGRVFGPLAHRLGSRLHCLAPDLRGHGESGVPRGPRLRLGRFRDRRPGGRRRLGLERPGRHRPFLRGRRAAARRGGPAGHLLGPLLLRARRVPLRRSARRRTRRARSRRRPGSGGRSSPRARGLCELRLEAAAQRPSTPRLSPPTSSSASKICPTARCGSGAGARTRRGSTRAALRPPRLLPARHGRMPGRARLRSREPQLHARRHSSRWSERLAHGRLEVLAGLGHFGPLEQPAVVADSVIRAIDPPPA